MGEVSFEQCSGYAGLEEVGVAHLVLVAWEVSLLVFFSLRMSLNFRVDISLRRDSLPNSMSIGFVDVECLCGTFHTFKRHGCPVVRQGGRLRCAPESLAIQTLLFKTKEK